MEYRVNQVQVLGTLSGSVRSLIDFFIGVVMKLIKLTQGRWATVDDDDYHWLNQWNWYAHKDGRAYYAMRQQIIPAGNDTKGVAVKVRMHRLITHCPRTLQVDHIDHDGLNNRRDNLRCCTTAQNAYNALPSPNGTSRYKGVRFHKYSWEARIQHNSNRIHIGCFSNEIEAAAAYDQKAKELFADFAYLNFPVGDCHGNDVMNLFGTERIGK